MCPWSSDNTIQLNVDALIYNLLRLDFIVQNQCNNEMNVLQQGSFSSQKIASDPPGNL